MTDRRPPISDALNAFGFDCLVTLPGEVSPIETRAFWLPARTNELPDGAALARSEPVRVLVLPLSEVGSVPRGTVVSAPPYAGASVSDWRVEESNRVDFDHHRCVVIPNPAS